MNPLEAMRLAEHPVASALPEQPPSADPAGLPPPDSAAPPAAAESGEDFPVVAPGVVDWPRITLGAYGSMHYAVDNREDYVRKSMTAAGEWDFRAHCARCSIPGGASLELNRTAKQPPKRKNGQGRPLGKLLAWLEYDCKGNYVCTKLRGSGESEKTFPSIYDLERLFQGRKAIRWLD
jgi:hypothetical protein